MDPKDNISDEFKELLEGINKGLQEQKNINEKLSGLIAYESTADQNPEKIPEQQEDSIEEDSDHNDGTKVFNVVKGKVENNELNSSTAANEKLMHDSDISSVNSDDGYNFVVSPACNTEYPTEFGPESKLPFGDKTPDNIQFNDFEEENIGPDAHNKAIGSYAAEDTNYQDVEPIKQSKKKLKRKKANKYGFVFTIIKYILYISFVLITSVTLAKYIIGVGNDMFAFVKDTYVVGDVSYNTEGNTDNTFSITNVELSGSRLTFEHGFDYELSQDELDTLSVIIEVVDQESNTIYYTYGDYNNKIKKGEKISLDLSVAGLKGSNYSIRLSANTVLNGEPISYISELPIKRILVDVNVPENATSKQIAELLNEKGVIDYPFAFSLYADFKMSRKTDPEQKKYLSGDFTLYTGISYDDIITAISPKKKAREIVKIKFPEGSTIDDILDLLEANGIQNDREDYIRVINEGYADFDYEFIKQLKEQGLPEGRVYALEGYMFPDTYDFYTDSSPETVIDKFLANFDKKFDDSFYIEAKSLGLTVDELIMVASLIEAETANAEDKGNISSVFHNRLKNPTDFGLLGSDATTPYGSLDLANELFTNVYKCAVCGNISDENQEICTNSDCPSIINKQKNTYTLLNNCAALTVDLEKLYRCIFCGNASDTQHDICPNIDCPANKGSEKNTYRKYDLIDTNYYINMNIKTSKSRQVQIIHINKNTSIQHNTDNDTFIEVPVYTLLNETELNAGKAAPATDDMKLSVEQVRIDGSKLICLFSFKHNYNAETFKSFPVKVGLFRTEYNTRNFRTGLMPSAVANPGLDSIINALYPSDTDYKFFVADKFGKSHFSETQAEHDQNIANLERDGTAVDFN